MTTPDPATLIQSILAREQARLIDLRLQFEQGRSEVPAVREVFRSLEGVLEELRFLNQRLRDQHHLATRRNVRLATRERFADLSADEDSVDAWFVTDPQGIIRDASRQAALLLGVRLRYLFGKPIINYVDLEERRAVRVQLLELLQSLDTGFREARVRIKPPRGEPFEASLRFTGERDAEQNLVSVRWVLRHIRPPDALTESDIYQLFVDSVEDFAIFQVDKDLRIVSWNRGAERIFGYTTAEAVGRDSRQLFVSEDRVGKVPEQEAERALREGRAEDERWHLRKDGSRFFASGIQVRLPGSDPIHRFVKILRDVTERRRMEEALQQAHDELEERVQERTVELAETNAALQGEIGERIHAEEERRELLRRWVQSLEEERRRISRELHDQMGQHLTAFALGLRALQDVCPPTSEAHTRLDRLRQMADEMGREVHRLAVELRPTALDDLGLAVALKAYVDAWGERAQILAQFDAVGMDRQQRLPGEIETTLYRIAQEALNNILKHAGATRVGILLQRHENHLTLIVEDDGRGFDVEQTLARTGRLGLSGMQERLALVGGTRDIESAPDEGTTLFVRVPLSPDPGRSESGQEDEMEDSQDF